MDGVVAYILGKSYTKKSLIGIGALAGAPCQVQSINKVDKTTTITLKWEDNEGGVHTQSFDIEDGLDGVSVTDATINPNGNLILTLSDGNEIDCGKVLPQYDTMPSPTSANVGQILQYIGNTGGGYNNGYYYKCVNDGGVYKWVNIKVQNSEDIFRYNIIPPANSAINGAIIQYIGATNANYTNGYYYQCIESPIGSGTYIWIQKNVQPNSGGGGEGVVDGYYNPDNHLFYEDSSYMNPISGESDTIYIDLNTNVLYRYDGSDFIKVSSASDSNIQVSTLPTADSSQENKIYQYIGATDPNYTNGYFYKCINDGGTYKWAGIATQDAYTKAEIGRLQDLPYANKNVVENIDLLYGSFSTLQASLANKVDKVAGKGLSSNDFTDEEKEKLSNLSPIYLIGSGLNLDAETGKLTATGIEIPIDDHLDTTSINPVQNKVIALKIDQLEASKLSISDIDDHLDKTSSDPVQNKVVALAIEQLQGSKLSISDIDSVLDKTSENPVQNKVIALTVEQLQGSMSNKADKVSGATNDDFATLDSNGNLKDSGINKNIIPTTATSSNKLATLNDIPENLDDLDDVVITSPVNKQILAYNSTSGKWENQTGQETIGGIVPKGSILFANLPTTGMSNGDAYDIKDAFVTDNRFEEGSGIECGAGTDVVWVADENKWNILTPSGVYSFNGRTGAVTSATSDYDADQIDYDNTTSGLTATDVQAAIDEVVNEKADKVSSATNGHLAGLDGNGNLTDSGVVASNVIEKVTTATGLLKDDGTVDTTSYAPSANAYLVGDTAETTIDDADYFPFYDTSATGKRKTLFSSIVNKLKNTFATLVTGTFTAGNLVSLDSSGNIADSNISSNDIRKTTTLSNVTSSDVIFKISGFGLNTGSSFVIRARGGENILFALGNSSQDVAISYGYSAFRVSGNSAYKINAMTYDYANNELYVNLGNYSILSIIQISGVTKYNLTITSVNSIPATDIYEIPIQNLNSKIDKVSATQNDIAIFDANGGVKDSEKKLSDLVLQWTQAGS